MEQDLSPLRIPRIYQPEFPDVRDQLHAEYLGFISG